VRTPLAAALAASLTLSISGFGRGQEVPGAVPTAPDQQPSLLQLSPKSVSGPVVGGANQQVAEAVAATLRQSPLLKQYHVTVSVVNGVAELSGTVLSLAQHAEVIRLASSVPGVLRVEDHLEVQTGTGIVQAQAAPFQPIPVQAVQPPRIEPVNPPQPGPGQPFPPMPQPQPGAGGFPPPGPGGPFPGPGPGIGGFPEPMPIQGTPPGFPSATQPPPLPPYAWPTYAPYNNFSRVAYPSLYPYESFPFIGPIYPFPRIPLGWRSVNLTWEDGHWWYGRNATGHDWWRIRYW
jgi:hypothetical protein